MKTNTFQAALPALLVALSASAVAQVPRAALSLPALTVPTASVSAAAAEDSPYEPYVDGAQCLFIGHSFFVPVALTFDGLAVQNGFPLHHVDTVFRPGADGAPGAMWDDPATRAAVEAVLATGDVELFGLASAGILDSGFEDYAQWFDLALQYNPETRFFIGTPWILAGPSLATDLYAAGNANFAYTTLAVVDQLRAAYPDERIDYLGYGSPASTMKAMFEAGNLPDITQLVGLGPNALFLDGLLGHAGPMLLEVTALVWMDTLYGAELGTLTTSPYASDIGAIVKGALDFNEPFEPLPDASNPLSADVGTLSLSAGGSQRLFLDAGPSRAGDLYLVLGSLSGTTPTPIPGTMLSLPLEDDAYFDLLFGSSEIQSTFNTLGYLDALGRAEAQITLAPISDPSLVGLVAHHAYVLVGRSGLDFVSNEVPLVLLH